MSYLVFNLICKRMGYSAKIISVYCNLQKSIKMCFNFLYENLLKGSETKTLRLDTMEKTLIFSLAESLNYLVRGLKTWVFNIIRAASKIARFFNCFLSP